MDEAAGARQGVWRYPTFSTVIPALVADLDSVAHPAEAPNVVVMSQTDSGELETAFQNSQSGKGIALHDVRQLKEFAAYARTRAAVVCNVETFEVRGDDWITRTDLSIYQGGAEDQELPPAERINLSEGALEEVLNAIKQEGIHCVFQVWADALQVTE